MKITRDAVLRDPDLLDRVVQEWRILHEAIRESPVHFAIYDKNDNLLAWNRSYEGNHPEAFALHRAEAEAGQLNYRTLLRYQIAQAVPAGEVDATINSLVQKQRKADGEAVIRQYPSTGFMMVYKYMLGSGAVAGLAINVDDLIEKEQELQAAKEEIEKLALQDDLTGLPNRRHLERHVAALRHAPDAANAKFALLHIDLDRFKHVNDTLGHAAGDHVLTVVGRILADHCEPEDLAARIGGDEFVLLRAGDVSTVAPLAESLVREISAPMAFEGRACQIGASIGITALPVEEADLDLVLSQSDLALYRAKDRGRGNVVFFERTIQEQSDADMKLAEDLNAAIEADAFFPVYQLQYDCKDRRIWGVETLCRWRRNDGTIATPDQFLHMARATSLIGEIDRALLRHIAIDLDQLSDCGIEIPKVSLNIEDDRMLDPILETDLANLRRPGLMISLEMREDVLLATPDEEVHFAIDALRERSIAVEIDAFGKRHACLTSLVKVSPDAVKIDRHIIKQCATSARHRRLVQTIAEVGGNLGISVMASGVEDAAQVDVVSELGCDAMQGFALSRPMDGESLIDTVRNRKSM